MSEEKPDPRQSELRYHVGYKMDPNDLGVLAEKWAELMCMGLPGQAIESITYEAKSWELVVTFK